MNIKETVLYILFFSCVILAMALIFQIFVINGLQDEIQYNDQRLDFIEHPTRVIIRTKEYGMAIELNNITWSYLPDIADKNSFYFPEVKYEGKLAKLYDGSNGNRGNLTIITDVYMILDAVFENK